ncbi:MAG TPA: class 1 fructose-bisphosphatase [Gammaproteobacteria bacterium]|nr:class 1 fructose-bisphosphatase [Gammaproteobacteria bacterium]
MIHTNSFLPLRRFLSRSESEIPEELQRLIIDVAQSCKLISMAVNQGALGDIYGSDDTQNIQGEVQKKLDIISNQILLEGTEWTGRIAGIASEEMDAVYPIPDPYIKGEYLLLFDPLDGSSNIDVNISVGTIFSILKCPDSAHRGSDNSFLQPGRAQVAAGYVIYGSSTVLVLTTGVTVNAFTLDQRLGEFILTHPNMRIPRSTAEFAINTSNLPYWTDPIRHYIDDCIAGKKGPRGKQFNMRWVGSMVADIHRTMTRGGIFLYPQDSKNPQLPAKLRLMYEANPMALLVETAGGLATTGTHPILEIQPEKLHQRVPVIMGSTEEVQVVLDYHQN